MLKLRKPSQETIRLLHVAAISACLPILFFLTLGYGYGELIHIDAGCVGIENFFTNTTFEQDYVAIMNAYNFTLAVPAKNPGALFRGEPVNCMSISNAIMCLSKLYPDHECAFYMVYALDNTLFMGNNDTEPGHMGIKCRSIRGRDGVKYYGNWIKEN